MGVGTIAEIKEQGAGQAWLAGVCLCAVACTTDVRNDSAFTGTAGSPTTTATGGPAQGTGGGTTASADGGSGLQDGSSDSALKLDVMGNAEQADDGGEAGCEKVDFLFVVDNSGSMEDEQANLVASFGGFIDTIQQTLMAQDYHIMVVDTDAEALSFSGLSCSNNVCTCTPEPQCCLALCANDGPIVVNPPPTECGGMDCDTYEVPTGCPVTLGAGKAEDPLGALCGIEGDRRYMTDTQADLVSTFECVAIVGAGGDGNERPMEAMANAVTTETAVDGCHEGFLRDDAILVVTFITDEEDEGSVGDPAAWRDGLIAAKGGNEEAVVVLGLLGDPGVPGGVCMDGQADDAPALRTFAESFTHGQWGSVCAPSYNTFFEAAVSSIDTSCNDFDPEG
ncbi:MAG: hypothetical protein AAF721_37640 [Myxococcota bacterium]